ncbi:MAG: flavin reductase family protein [Acidimicrobiia bacterium]
MTERETTATGVTPDVLRRVLGGFPTGVTVVTATRERERHGMTLNSLTSVSLEPPLVLVCLHNDSRTLWAVQGSGWFAINFLAQGQEGVSNAFARRGEDHFAGMAAPEDGDAPPLIPGRIAHLLCQVETIHPGGDHHVVLGRVAEGVSNELPPLVFFKGRYHRLGGLDSDAEALWYW